MDPSWAMKGIFGSSDMIRHLWDPRIFGNFRTSPPLAPFFADFWQPKRDTLRNVVS